MDNLMVTGGTGSIGTEILKNIEAKRKVVYSRDEYKQMVLKDEIPDIECVIGDIRDADALYNALYGIDTVIHCAALKQLPRGETDPLEFKKTNVDGAVALIDACIAQDVKKCVVISTDKAVEPISAYGMSKALADKLFIDANKYHKTSFVICRFGNVMGSRGSVIWKWKALVDEGKTLTVTHSDATRYWLEIPKLLETIRTAIDVGEMNRGEIMIPIMPSFNVMELAAIFQDDNKCMIPIVGLRKGEKPHETLIPWYEKWRSWGGVYTVKGDYALYKTDDWKQQAVESFTNDWWLTQTEMREKIDKLCQRDVRCGDVKTV